MKARQPVSIKFHHTETSASALTPMSNLIPMKAGNQPPNTYDKEHHEFACYTQCGPKVPGLNFLPLSYQSHLPGGD